MRRFSSMAASRVGKLITSLLIASQCVLPEVSAFNFTSIPSANLDLGSLGRVALGGNFDSISIYEFVGQNENAAGSNGALLSRYPNGEFATINQTDGDILAMCPFVANNTLQGIVFGGNFTSVGGMNTPGGIALLNPNTSVVTPLPGLNGSVSALYCDATGGRVYIGGSFSGGGASNAIVWVTGWTNMPFAGFNGPVSSITKAPDGNIIFGGKFNGLGNSTTPKETDAQVIPVASANISATQSSGTTGFSDPRNIICKTGDQDGSGNTWLLADNVPGSWTASFGFGFEPTKLRLYNTKQDGRGTKTFRYTALPDGGILNFTYVDPSTGQQSFCDARCPLPQGNTSAQDFKFVNTVGMNSFRIDISDWYGSGAGLSGIELFQNDIYSFAVNDFNEPKCDGVSTGATSINSTKTGTAWVVTPSGESNSEYLMATLVGSNIDPESAKVVFQPDIRQSGNYSVTVFTPGCRGDNTCTTRGRVNITGSMTSSTTSSNPPLSTQLFQTNDFDKYDQVYFGYVDATDSGFRPSVTLQPMPNQNGPLTVVAQRVRFELLSATSGNLNGLFEYDPSQQVVDSDLSKSNINVAGASLSPRDQAFITSLAVQGDTTFVGGNFSGDGFSNIFSIGTGNATSLPGNGLNNQVMTMYQNGSLIYVGGNFTNTQDNKSTGLNGIAAYSTSDKKWQALGAGVDGVVMYIVPFTLNLTANRPEAVIGVSGTFQNVNGFGSNSSSTAQNFAIWVPSRSNWLQNLDVSSLSITGQLLAQSEIPGSSPLFSGSISSQGLGASGAVGLNSNKAASLQHYPFSVRPQQQSTQSLRKRDTNTQQNQTGILAATFYHQNNLNITVLGGHFSASGTDGSNITNLAFINGTDSDKISGITTGIQSDSIVKSLATSGTNLLVGGQILGNVNGNSVAGVFVYDLKTSAFNGTQPPGLRGTNVSVNSIAVRPKSTDVYVGGTFDSAGSLSCPAVCLWSADRSQWVSPGSGLSGTVSAMSWVSNTELLVAGNLTASNNNTYLVSFNSKNNQFTSFNSAGTLPGPITALCPANNDGSQLWVGGTATNGSAFLQHYDGKKWVAAPSGFGDGTLIQGLQVFSVSSNHAKNQLVDQGEVLLVLGQLNITNFGSASGALFNGTTYTPFILASSEGSAGSLSSVFVENPDNFFKNGKKHLAVGFVVLIALAIALVLTFLLVVAGILLEWYRKKSQGYDRVPQHFTDKSANINRVPPEHLFGTLGNRHGQAPEI